MKRRCYILDILPAFNYNTGSAEYKKGNKVPTNTRKLGSTLMQTMLSEVINLCKPNINGDWSFRAHQQVCFLSFFDTCQIKKAITTCSCTAGPNNTMRE